MIPSRLRTFVRDDDGAAAAEIGMFVLIVVPLLLNLADLGGYVYQRMEVYNAAQAGAQAAFANCSVKPASSTNCPNMSTAVTSAVRSTILGSDVIWSNSATIWTNPDVTYYCPNSATNSLVSQAGATPMCSATTSTNTTPGTYAKITVSYNFRPMFAGATIASLFTTPITTTTYMRLY